MQVLDMTDGVACGDDAQHGKPHPELYWVALNKLGLSDPSCAMAVGDSVYDAIAAKALGLQVTGLLSGRFSREALTMAGCGLVLAHVKDLSDHLVRN
jgi:phosphoglycolate phosphatase-like HAD superfamily hydrolase